jgi:hypothetical protein
MFCGRSGLSFMGRVQRSRMMQRCKEKSTRQSARRSMAQLHGALAGDAFARKQDALPAWDAAQHDPVLLGDRLVSQVDMST